MGRRTSENETKSRSDRETPKTDCRCNSNMQMGNRDDMQYAMAGETSNTGGGKRDQEEESPRGVKRNQTTFVEESTLSGASGVFISLPEDGDGRFSYKTHWRLAGGKPRETVNGVKT